MPIGTTELIVILVIIVVIFGSTKLPQLGDGLGRAIKNFKRAVSNPSEIDVTPKKPEPPVIPPGSPAAPDADKATK